MVNDSQKYIYIERSKLEGFLLILVRLDIDLFKKKKGYIWDIFYFNIL